MTYDQWKTRAPDCDGPDTCECCGGNLRFDTRFNLVCDTCAEIEAEEVARADFYQWEPAQ